MSSDEFVLVDRPRDHVALVTLNRPERMNSMAFDVMVPLKRVLEDLTNDNSVRAVVLKSHLWPSVSLTPFLAELYTGSVSARRNVLVVPSMTSRIEYAAGPPANIPGTPGSGSGVISSSARA